MLRFAVVTGVYGALVTMAGLLRRDDRTGKVQIISALYGYLELRSEDYESVVEVSDVPYVCEAEMKLQPLDGKFDNFHAVQALLNASTKRARR